MDNTIKPEEKKLDQIKSLVRASTSNLEKIISLVEKIEQEEKKEYYKALPGVEGMFDGVALMISDGSKLEVPPNYAAKSRLVFGDKLKVIEEDGKKVFKQIEKVERKLIKGILSKKEGKWFLLSDSGSYRISDVAAEFNKAELNEEAEGFIPADNMNVPYAALDRIIRKQENIVKPEQQDRTVKPINKESKPVSSEIKKTVPSPAPKMPSSPIKAKPIKVEKDSKDIKKKPPFVRPVTAPPKIEVKKEEGFDNIQNNEKSQPLIVVEEDDLR